MTFALELTVRMVGAALFGAAIGYEREVRGKGAGVRTHLLLRILMEELIKFDKTFFESVTTFV